MLDIDLLLILEMYIHFEHGVAMRYFAADHVKVEPLDANDSIITIQCSTFLAADILELIDSLAHACRWTNTQCRMTRTSLVNKGRNVA